MGMCAGSAQLKRHGDTRTFDAHAIVIDEGDSTDSLYVVLSGRLVVYSNSDSGHEVVLAEYGAGEYFGELALGGERRPASVRAVETSTCCIAQGLQLRALLDERPGLATHLTQQDPADRIASSSEMVNRLLKELMAGGYVALRDGRYVICRKLPLHW